MSDTEASAADTGDETEAVAAPYSKPFELLSNETLGWLALLGGAALACVFLPVLLAPPPGK